MAKTKRSYMEIRKEAQAATSVQELRRLHKELRAYGDGVPFFDRYPKARAPIMAVVRVMFRIVAILLGSLIGSSIGIMVVLLLLGIR